LFVADTTLFLLKEPLTQKHFVLGVQFCVSEDLNHCATAHQKAMRKEQAREAFNEVRDYVFEASGKNLQLLNLPSIACRRAKRSGNLQGPDFSIFSARLQDHAVLLRDGLTIARREPQVLNHGCLVFSDCPVVPKVSGLQFSVRIDGLTTAFKGWPVLGFTRRQPSDTPNLYPSTSRFLGASCLIGGVGEATARDPLEHLFPPGMMGLRRTQAHSAMEISEYWLQPELPLYKREPPVDLEAGDMLECRYTWKGQLQLFLNGTLAMDFDIGRPIDAQSSYFAVIDVLSSVTSLTVVPCTKFAQQLSQDNYFLNKEVMRVKERLETSDHWRREVSVSQQSTPTVATTRADSDNSHEDED
jgi:hypothetical protein